MRRRLLTVTITGLVLVGFAVALAGCGDTTPPASGADAPAGASAAEPAGSSQSASRPLDLVMPDCSHSFRRESLRMVSQMVEVALDSAARDRTLWAGCFTGSPLRDLVWNPQIDFGDLPAPIATNHRLAKRFNTARALGLRKEFQRIIRRTPRKVPGSGQLEALELASQTPGVGRVFMFTDARIFEPDGIPLSTASHAEVEEAVERWAPRMRGLNEVEIVLVGGGLGALSAQAVRNAHALFGGLAREVGASFSWTRSLPMGF
jgi:hypothetical protein